MSITRIPGEVVRPIIQSYIDQYETYWTENIPVGGEGWFPELNPVYVLAREAGVRPDTLRKFLDRGSSIDFYTLDKLLCAMDMPMLWWSERLRPYYLAADLSSSPPGYKICARAGCEQEFKIVYSGKSNEKKYCSKACRHAANLHRRGKTARAVTCRNGHPRPEGYDGHSGPGRYCQECERENQRRYRAQRREQAAA